MALMGARVLQGMRGRALLLDIRACPRRALRGEPALGYVDHRTSSASGSVLPRSPTQAAVRGLETYIGSCAFRLVVRRLEGAPQLQQRASLVFGQAVMYVQLACGVLAFALVQSGSISCTL